MTTLIERSFNTIYEPTFLGEDVIIGEGNEIGPFTTVGTKGEHWDAYPDHPPGKIIIGNHNIIRELVSIQRPVLTGVTKIGNYCFIMAHCHIPHDACLEDYVQISPGTKIAGHAYLMHHANCGLNTVIHQHRIIGSYTMIGMGSIVTHDIPPFAKYYAMRIHGANRIGMQRHGFTEEEIRDVEKYYAKEPILFCDLSERVQHEFTMFKTIQARWKI